MMETLLRNSYCPKKMNTKNNIFFKNQVLSSILGAWQTAPLYCNSGIVRSQNPILYTNANPDWDYFCHTVITGKRSWTHECCITYYPIHPDVFVCQLNTKYIIWEQTNRSRNFMWLEVDYLLGYASILDVIWCCSCMIITLRQNISFQ